MQDEDIYFGQNDLGKIFIYLNSLKKSGFRKKKLVTLFLVTPLRRYGFSKLMTANNVPFDLPTNESKSTYCSS